MDLSKSYDFFQPDMVRDRIHIIGCGAVGSTAAELLVRVGLTNITLYDFDTVEPHNLGNQMYRYSDIGKPKTQALADILREINPDIEKGLRLEGRYTHQRLSGFVFLCLDNIDLRRQIVEANVRNPYIRAVFDTRIRLEDAQHYAADWHNEEMVNNLIASMQFTHEEAQAETPRSACNLELSVAPTVRDIAAKAVANFMNFAKGGELRKMILTNSFTFGVDAF